MSSSQASNAKGRTSHSRDSRSLSRAPTSPVSVAPSTNPTESAYLHTSLSSLLVPPDLTIESLIERHSPNSSNPPSAASLHALHDDITTRVLSHVRSREHVCDKGMRELARKRKDRIDDDRAREEREREEERKKRERQKAAAALAASAKKKEAERQAMPDRDTNPVRPPVVGAHGLARQDGVDVHKETTSSPPLIALPDPQAPVHSATSPATSEASHQPPPAPTVARYETFGDDPTEFDDPTVYHIRDLTPDMTEEEKKRILCVSHYPRHDLDNMIPGTPPDMDFSNAKPSNQINFSTFQASVEPYIRPLTEEDVAFLKERGDRVTPYMMPKRGPSPYREVWAKEDGSAYNDLTKTRNPNEPRGSIEDMNDEKAETDQFSNPPILSRLLQTFRHEPTMSNTDTSTQQNPDVSMLNNDDAAVVNQDSDAPFAQPNGTTDDDALLNFKPATYFSELSATPTFKLPTSSSRDVASLDQRALQELRYCGFLSPDATPDYDSHYDDEVAERLRHLQNELRIISRENGARKARVLELTEERMAMQEYSTIADDLDSQINTAYLKRNRTMSKPKKGAGKARPGHAGTGGVAVSRNAVSDGVRMLMDRRKEWRELIGPVVDFGQTSIPKNTVFDKATMERLDKAEAEAGHAEGA